MVKLSVFRCHGMEHKRIMMVFTPQNNLGFKHLLTSRFRLNQDDIKNTFSGFRQLGGFNRNPTARTFRT